MAPYNTRFRKRKAESDYQELRAEFGLDPMPMEEARRRQREHEREARAETAAAAAVLDRALAAPAEEAPAEAQNDAVAAVAGVAEGDAQTDAAFFNVSVDTIQEADARALDNEDIAAGRVPRRAAARANTVPTMHAMAGERVRDSHVASALRYQLEAEQAHQQTTNPIPRGIGLSVSHARILGEELDPGLRRLAAAAEHRATNEEEAQSIALLRQHDAASDDAADPSAFLDGYESDDDVAPPNLPDNPETPNAAAAQAVTQSPPAPVAPFGLRAIEDSVVASSTMRSYNADAFQFLSWLFRTSRWDYLTHYCIHLFQSIVPRQQSETSTRFIETEKQYHTRLSQAIKNALTRCKTEPLIVPEKMDEICFITWMDGLYNQKTGKKLSASSYGNKRAMLNHLFRLHNDVGIPPELDKKVAIKMQGFYRQLAKSRPAGYKDAGKSPMSAELYQAIAHWFLEWGTLNGIFAHCFLVLSWNLMCRSENTQNIHLCDMTWTGFDCFEIKFAHTKSDQKGEAAKYTRHIYANPFNPTICPVMALAMYLSCSSNTAEMDDPLFPSGGGGKTGQAARFGELLATVLDEHVAELIAMGYPSSSDLGTHSIRKGAVTHVAGLPGGPSSTSICVRAGWTQGKVKDIYMKYMEAGDCFVGRCLTLSPLLSTDFAASPPIYCDYDPGSVLPPVVLDAIDRQFKAYSRITHFGKLLPQCYARLIWDLNYLSSFPQNHPVMNSDILTNGEVFHFLKEKSHEVVEVGGPWELNDIEKYPGRNCAFSGCPPHIGMLQQIIKMKEDQKKQAKEFAEAVKKIVEERVAAGGGLTVEKFQEVFKNSITQLTSKLQAFGVTAENAAAAADAPAAGIEGDGSRVVEDVDNQLDGLDAEAFHLHHHGEGIDSFWSKLPKGWEFPTGSGWDMWLKYWIGNTRTGCPPLRFICSEDLKYLDETPIDNMRGRTGTHKEKKRPARKIWCDYKHLMDWCKFICNKEGHLLPGQEFPVTADYFNALWKDYIEPAMIAEGIMKAGARAVKWNTIVRRMQRQKDDSGRSLAQRWKTEEATIALPTVMETALAEGNTLDDGDDGSEEG